MERTKRTGGKKKKAQKLSALEQLRLAREGGSRNEQFVEEDEEDIYDVVAEEDYHDLVKKRQEREDFVVDDDGIGYIDDGEEHQLNDAPRDNGRRKSGSSAKENKELKKARKLQQDVQVAQPSEKVGGMMAFMNRGSAAAPDTKADPHKALKRPKSAIQKTIHTIDIDSMDLDAMITSNNSKKTKTFRKAAHKKRSSSSLVGPALDASMVFGTAPVDDFSSGGNDFSIDDPMPVDDAAEAGAQHTALSSTEAIADIPAKRSRFGSRSDGQRAATKAAAAAAAVSEAQAVAKAPLPAVAAPTIVNAQTLGDDIILEADNNQSSGSSSSIAPDLWLGRNEETGGTYLDLFWIDALETNGNVYMFGKVLMKSSSDNEASAAKESPKYTSCCVVVKNVQRCMFVLPKNTGEVDDEGNPKRYPWDQVHKEINSILVPACIPRGTGQGFRCKVVKRKYVFEDLEIPREETEYLKVVYSAAHAAPPLDGFMNGGKTFSKIMGAHTAPLEHFLVKRKLMGPTWVRIINPEVKEFPTASHCKIEVNVDDPKLITKAENTAATPPVNTMTIQMKTVVNPKTHAHEIVALAAAVHKDVNLDCATEENRRGMKWFVAVRPLGASAGPQHMARLPHDLADTLQKCNMGQVERCPNERALISKFLMRIFKEDPDILVSHNLFGFDFDVLLTRAVEHKLGFWSRLGRLKRNKLPIMKSKTGNSRERAIADACAGRILCDTYLSARDLLREENYSLTHLSKVQLQESRTEIDPMDVPNYFSSSNHITNLVKQMCHSTSLVQRLLFKLQVLPLTKQLTGIAGNLWSSTAKGGDRAKRVEFLLLHEFHRLKYICPDKQTWAMKEHKNMLAGISEVAPQKKGRGKPQYSGGLVLEPKKGLYETFILLLDFNSLYPSIIQEYNLCFTTMEWAHYIPKNLGGPGGLPGATADDEGMELGDATKMELPPLPEDSAERGVVPKVIKSIIDRRVTVKGILKQERDPAKRQTLDIRQKALKLTANSLYGCLGFGNSRFFAKPIAALVTAMGRETLQRTVDLAQTQLNLEVIYGDTDSIMINTNSTDLAVVKDLGNQVKREVNKLYKTLELEMDGIFKSMLLLKKKKYAALVVEEDGSGNVTYSKETKGLDLVRRDWCRLSKSLGQFVLDHILSGESRESVVTKIHEKMDEISKKMRAFEVPIDEYVVTKGMNKSVKDYPDAKSQPHLQVALAMLKEGKAVNTGDHIPYVICVKPNSEEAEPSSFAQRAYHPDVVTRSQGALQIDVEWYLNQQILPPISRLCEPIEGTSTALLAEHLGLDSSKYVKKASMEDDLSEFCDFVPSSKMDDAERFKGTKPWTLNCVKCGTASEFPGVVNSKNGKSGLICPIGNCSAEFWGSKNPGACFSRLSNLLTMRLRQDKLKYYSNWLVCDDPSCGFRTQQQSIVGNICLSRGCNGRMQPEFGDKLLYTQLKYFDVMFDEAEQKKKYAGKMPSIPKSHTDVFSMLKKQMDTELKQCGYNYCKLPF